MNDVALPINPPLALKNETLPAQVAAVPLDELAASLAKLTATVSVLPMVTGGKEATRAALTVGIICPNAEARVPMATAAKVLENFEIMP